MSVEHFPRRDDEYLAQIKKLCVDRCVTIAAINTSVAFGAADIDPDLEHMNQAVDMAAAVGAPLVRFSSGEATGSPGIAWRELVRGLKAASAHAKQRNVTLAIGPRAGTMVADDADVKRVFKECDSAWLRLAAPATPEWEASGLSAVIVVMAPAGSDIGVAQRFRGYVSLEDVAGDLDTSRLARWVESLYLA
jgi:hypothetical protein